MELTINNSDQNANQNSDQIKAETNATQDALLSCLITTLGLFDLPYSKKSLTAGLPLINGKLTPELFTRAAERGGLTTKAASFDLNKMTNKHLPCVLLLKNNDACVLTEILSNGLAKIIRPETINESTNEPAQKNLKNSKEIKFDELNAQYSGQTIFVKKTYQFDTRAESPTPSKSKAWFWKVVAKAWPIYSEVLAASFLINMFAVAVPLFIMNVYDRVVPNKAIETLWVLSIGMFIVIIFEFTMRSLRGYFIDIAGKKIDTQLSAATFEQILGLRMSDRPPSVGSLANTMTAFESFREFITSATISLLVDLPFILIFLAVIFLLSSSIAIVPLVAIPLIVGVSLLLQIPLEKLVTDSYRHSAEKQAILVETLGSAETIKTLNAEGPRQRRWENLIHASATISAKIRLFVNFGVNFAISIQFLTTVAVVITGVYLISHGELTIGALIACTILTGRALAPIIQIAGLLIRYKQSKAALNSLDNIMQLTTDRPKEKIFLKRPSLKGAIEFDQISLSYQEESVPALNNVSFRIQPGEHVGIIGRAGSGKSSIQKLLLKLYQPTQGRILVDGSEINQIDPAELRYHIGYIPQNVVLFHGSIRDNIVMSAPNIDDAAILRATELSGINNFVNQHSDGFDRQVGERGQFLSGGQQQAIGIARALLTNPNILVFDEPTNSLDNLSSKQFIEKIKALLKDKTLILVSHKASTLELVNRLIVVDSGKIIADGPKEKILESLKNKTTGHANEKPNE